MKVEEITLTINSNKIKVRPGTTVLQAALENQIHIPNLCYDPRLSPTGSCRLCLVEVEGQAELQTSCTLMVREGMVVRTDTEEIKNLRKTVLKLLISEHNMDCASCDKDGDCLLQDYAYEYGVERGSLPQIELPEDLINYTDGDKAIVYDPSKCIRCQRCVKICAEVQCVEALTLVGRAGQVFVSTGFDIPLKESTCETCGLCVSTCPTSALYERAASGRGKAKDLKKTLTTCPYCGVGCQVYLNVHSMTGELVRVTTETGMVPNDGNTCVKGRFGMDFLNKKDRLKYPLIKEKGKFKRASWNKALNLITGRFLEIRKESGSDTLAALSSAKTTNEDNYIMQKFARAVLGTNNVDHCARLCHASTVAGLARAFGSGAMTNSIEELGRAPLVFVIGSNTTECHPVIGILIRQAVASGQTRLIVADPREISLAAIADIHLKQKPGSDVALINGMMHVILDEGLESRDFIRDRTEGFNEFKEAVMECPPGTASKITGIPEKDIVQAARLYAKAESASIVYSMGITQHTTGTDNVLSLANLAMLTGNVGKESSGVNPLRGQNNVQGACDLGALPDVYSGYQKVEDPEARSKFEKAWGVKLPEKSGLTVVEIMNAAYDRKIKGLYIMGENPALSDPDINHVKEALKKLDFLVVQDIFLSETAELAHVVLPALSFAEKDGTFTNTERRVQRIRRAMVPPGEAKDDWQIICEIAGRMGYRMEYPGALEIMDEIASLTPIYGGISYKRIEEEGLQWPCPSATHPGTKFLHKEKFSRGRGKFHPVRYIYQQELPDGEFPFIFTTGRVLQHWHTGTMTRRSEVLNDLVSHGTLEVNPEDAESLNISQGETVSVSSRRGRIQVPVKITGKIKRGTTFLAFHFKEHPANALTISALDPIAKIPEYKACAVKIEKMDSPDDG